MKTASSPKTAASLAATELLDSAVPEDGSEPHAMTEEIRQQMIAEAAYYRAEARDFAPGYELEDWLEAQDDVDRSLRSSEVGLSLAAD
jgi:hypothetical protein